jgi:dynein heavy chain
MKSLQDIEVTFERLINQLKNLNYDILDVKATRWHDDYNAYKRDIKDLEVMARNVITAAFETVTTVQVGIEVMGTFVHLIKREAIKRTIDKKAVEIYAIFLDDLSKVKREFDHGKYDAPVNPIFPRVAGTAMWANSLLKRIHFQWRLLQNAYYLADFPNEITVEASNQYSQVCNILVDYITKVMQNLIVVVSQNLIEFYCSCILSGLQMLKTTFWTDLLFLSWLEMKNLNCLNPILIQL